MSQTPPEHTPEPLEIDAEISADPLLGRVVRNYPSNRLRLVIVGALVYGVVGMLINTAFLPFDPDTVAPYAIGALSVLALSVGWFVLHLWNREVVVYERGFSYRQGSQVGFFHFENIRSIHLRAERISYFGGLVKREYRDMLLVSDLDEQMRLNRWYSSIDLLMRHLEREITPRLRDAAQVRMDAGGAVDFGGGLTLDRDGILLEGQRLSWAGFSGVQAAGGALILQSAGGEWGRVPLDSLENVMVLVVLLRAHLPPQKASSEA